MMRIGVVSDTHGLWREGVAGQLAGCDRILHAGDVGDPEILARLGRLAPVEAVRGNVDHGPLGRLPATAAGELEEVSWRMVHRRQDVPADWPREAGLVVFGHSHRPELEWVNSCLLLNPGAIGPRRFTLPLTLAILTIDGARITPEILAVES